MLPNNYDNNVNDNDNDRYNMEHAGRLDRETEDERKNMEKLLRDTSDLSKLREKVENFSSGGWERVKEEKEGEI